LTELYSEIVTGSRVLDGWQKQAITRFDPMMSVIAMLRQPPHRGRLSPTGFSREETLRRSVLSSVGSEGLRHRRATRAFKLETDSIPTI
jgi:hypothetical protein